MTNRQMELNDQIAENLTLEHTVHKLVEEMAELTTELMKAMIGNDNTDEIIAEIGDVELLLYQFKTKMNIHVEVEEAIDDKLDRFI